MNTHENLNYVEFPSRDLSKTKAFFSSVFSWTFTDYGPEYTAFSKSGLDGGFFASDLCSKTENGSALLVFYSDNLEQTREKILAADGVIVRPVFDFPGGRRFHFCEPGGNEFAVWSDKAPTT